MSQRVVFIGRRPTAILLPPRYSQEQWKTSSKFTHESSQGERQLAERWMANGFQEIDQTEEMRLKGQQEVNWKLQQRIQDLNLWTEQLTAKSEEISRLIDDFGIYIKRMDNAMKSIPSVIQTDMQILRYRNARQEIDLVNDDPQKEIIIEKNLLQTCQSELNKMMQICQEKLRLLRKFWFELQKEINDKKAAVEIDTLVSRINPHSSQVQRQSKESIKDLGNVLNESEWEEQTKRFNTTAEKLIRETENLEVEVESLLRQVCEYLQKQVCNTNAAFERRLIELRDAKSKLEIEHKDISIRIREMENLIDKLDKSMKEKESSIALTETRIYVRNQRPNNELVMDVVQKSLHLELRELKELIKRMEMQVIQSHKALRSLLSQQVALEEDINIKVNSIAIDEIQVMPLRKTISVYKH